MFELDVKVVTRELGFENFKSHFTKPLIYYMVNKNDDMSFFITYVLVDFNNNKMTYIYSYSDSNKRILEMQDEIERYHMSKCPHNSIQVKENESFLTFNEDEKFFTFINYVEKKMYVCTMKDLIPESEIKFEKISHTFYKDDTDPSYFYLSAVDTEQILHIYRISLDLKDITEVNSFEGKPIPPHVLRNHMDYFFLSDEFRYSQFELTKKNKIVTQDELSRMYFKLSVKLNVGREVPMSFREERATLYEEMRRKYGIKCMQGRIMMINRKTNEQTYYNTTGGSPAHFEIDSKQNFVYTSAHNFFGVKDGVIYFEPAIIDKFEIVDDKLVHKGAFSYEKGYRYTSHKIFSVGGKTYICTFGQPNRLIFADADTMELLFYEDIGEDELSSQDDVSLYINSSGNNTEIIAIEVSPDNKLIVFVDGTYLYLYDFEKRQICKKVRHGFDTGDNEIKMDDFKIRTVHFNYLS